MSSRILREPASVQPLDWQRLGFAPPVAAKPAESAPSPELAERIAWMEREAEARAEAARRQGHAEGLAEAERVAQTRVQPMLERLARTVEDLAMTKRHLRTDAEKEMVRLSVEIARRILHRELTVDPEALLGLVRSALERMDSRELYKVRVHPTDRGRVEAEMRRLGLPESIAVEGDLGLEAGSAIFETHRGTLDASVATQLNEVERGLADRAGRRR
jgi:flagellar assembly protein FliH